MPYMDVDLIRRLFHNAERARTCNSWLNSIPGMYASVNNITDASGEILELDVITPYSVFPAIGTGISSFVSWDSTVTTLAALLGGVTDFVRRKMQRDGVYDEFIAIAEKEYSLAFDKPLVGENIDLCLPGVGVPVTDLVMDYEACI